MLFGVHYLQDFRELKVWQKSHQMVLSVYRLSQSFPKEERYGLISQLRRSAVSIPATLPKVAVVEQMRILADSFTSRLAQRMKQNIT